MHLPISARETRAVSKARGLGLKVDWPTNETPHFYWLRDAASGASVAGDHLTIDELESVLADLDQMGPSA
jgi:hypothetical protein